MIQDPVMLGLAAAVLFLLIVGVLLWACWQSEGVLCYECDGEMHPTPGKPGWYSCDSGHWRHLSEG